MIGALGISVAIGGFLFLWVMLNYQTMNQLKLQLEELETSMKELDEQDQQLSVHKKRYSIKKQRYNHMVTEMPSKMVAVLFKHKPIV